MATDNVLHLFVNYAVVEIELLYMGKTNFWQVLWDIIMGKVHC